MKKQNKEKNVNKPKKKVKLNEKALKKEMKYQSEDSNEIKRFVFILIGVIVAIVATYGITRVFVEEPTPKEPEVTEGEINYKLVSVGTMLNRDVKEYYVVVYDSTTADAIRYSTVVSKYVSGKNALPVYFCDLNNKLNSAYYAGENGQSNPDAKEVSEFKFGDLTLVKVKGGKVVKYVEGFDTIKKELEK